MDGHDRSRRSNTTAYGQSETRAQIYNNSGVGPCKAGATPPSYTLPALSQPLSLVSREPDKPGCRSHLIRVLPLLVMWTWLKQHVDLLSTVDVYWVRGAFSWCSWGPDCLWGFEPPGFNGTIKLFMQVLDNKREEAFSLRGGRVRYLPRMVDTHTLTPSVEQNGKGSCRLDVCLT